MSTYHCPVHKTLNPTNTPPSDMIQIAHKVAILALSTPQMLKQINIDPAVQFLQHSYIDHIEEYLILKCMSCMSNQHIPKSVWYNIKKNPL